MLPLAFIGGALFGAAGLAVAAMVDKQKTEAGFPPSLKRCAELDRHDISMLLTDYYIRENQLATECGVLVAECGNCYPAIEMPDENLAEKVFRLADNVMTPKIRKWDHDKMLSLRDEAQKLYARYKPAFLRANKLLREEGQSPLDLRAITFKGVDFSLDNSAENENWVFDLLDLSDKIRNFLDISGDIAEKMINFLDETKTCPAIAAE